MFQSLFFPLPVLIILFSSVGSCSLFDAGGFFLLCSFMFHNEMLFMGMRGIFAGTVIGRFMFLVIAEQSHVWAVFCHSEGLSVNVCAVVSANWLAALG